MQSNEERRKLLTRYFSHAKSGPNGPTKNLYARFACTMCGDEVMRPLSKVVSDIRWGKNVKFCSHSCRVKHYLCCHVDDDLLEELDFNDC